MRGHSRFVWAAVIASAIGLWCIVISHFDSTAPLHVEMSLFVRSIATWLFLTAGVLRASAWRLTGDRERAQSALALLAIGVALVISTATAPLLGYGSTARLEEMAARLILIGPLLVLVVVRARRDRRLARRCAATFLTVVVAIPALLGILTDTAPADVRWPELWVGLEALTVAAWSTMAVQSCWHDPVTGLRARRWITVGLLLMAADDSLKAWVMSDARAIANLDNGFQLAAAAIAMAMATADLVTTLRRDTAQSTELVGALREVRRELERLQRAHRTMIHDARSAVVGVVGASQLLAGNDTAGADAARIRRLVMDELIRLQALLDTDHEEPVVEFAVAEALEPVVLSHQVEGAVILSERSDVRAVGRPRATATAVDNLLRNVAQHAPGARTWLTLRADRDDVVITVRDDGAGIPADERRRVLLAGVRGSTSRGDGSGLGLYSAARTMSAQGGSLTISDTAGVGTVIVLRLPAAAATPNRLAAMAS
jgi:signal transduction histidine kinase